MTGWRGVGWVGEREGGGWDHSRSSPLAEVAMEAAREGLQGQERPCVSV